MPRVIAQVAISFIVVAAGSFFFASAPSAAADGPGSIVLPFEAAVSVSKVSAETICSGDFGLASPTHVLLLHDYLPMPERTTVDVGTYPAGTALVFFFEPWVTSGYCGGSYLSTDPGRAHITADGTGWTISWEDSTLIDFNDLVVHVTVKATGVVLNGSGWFGGRGVNVCYPAGDLATDPAYYRTTEYCGDASATNLHVGTPDTGYGYWQCVELAQRFFQAQGWSVGAFSGVSVASQIEQWAQDESKTNGSHIEWHPASTGDPPVPGDLLVTGGSVGHVNVVDSVGALVSGARAITVVEQNWTGNTSGWAYYDQKQVAGVWQFVRTVPGTDGRTVLGFVHAKANQPVASLREGAALSTTGASITGVPVTVTWGAVPAVSAPRYTLEVTGNGGTTWPAVATGTKTTASTGIASGGTAYRFRFRSAVAPYTSGNVLGPSTSVRLYQQASSAVHYSSGWTTASSSSASGGSTRYATRAGSWASFSFTGRGVAWVAPRSATRGKAKVYIDGRYVKTVDLYAASGQSRRLVWAPMFAASGAHTIKFVVSGTPERPRVDVDAFVVLR